MYQYCILRRHIELNRDRYCTVIQQNNHSTLKYYDHWELLVKILYQYTEYHTGCFFHSHVNKLCGTHILPMQSKSWKSYIAIGLLQIFKYWRWCTRINFHFMFLISSLSSQIYLVTDNKWYCFINWFIFFFAYIGDSTSSISRKHGTSVSEA